MMIYQKKFAEKQNLMNRFVDIGTDLFVMSASCAYADALSKKGNTNAVALADYFCKGAKIRIGRNFHDIRFNHDKATKKLSKDFLAGHFEWLENEIIKPPEN